jgi:para-aminobenzoate synthetase component 1
MIRFRTDDILAKHHVFWARSLFPQGYADPFARFRQVLAFSNSSEILSDFSAGGPKSKPMFGCVGYNLKNRFEKLYSNKQDPVGFPDFGFVEAQGFFTDDEFGWEDAFPRTLNAIKVTPRMSRTDYMEAVRRVKEHLRAGDIYEMNLCMEFYAEGVFTDPFSLYLKLTEASPMPFSCFLKMGSRYLICASPERYLAKRASRLISQPIKGTAPRGLNEADDLRLAEELLTSEKEKSENTMIVDLVRNDLSRVAKPDSVRVDELCKLHAFPGVFQLISTVSCEVENETTFEDFLKASFPPGSMTGAPKISAMQLIERYEKSNRGLFSGAVGYLLPDGDFDLNVVIRSLFYNAETGYLSFQVGGAITLLSDPQAEYEECMVKASAMARVLGVNLREL